MFSACENGIDFNVLPKDAILHDNGSKVWIVDKILRSQNNFASSKTHEKSILVFYNSNNCLLQPLLSMGSSGARHGSYTLKNNNELTIHFEDELWIFEVNQIKSSFVELIPKSNSNLPYELHLKPFPEL
jgi:hypothetical protein